MTFDTTRRSKTVFKKVDVLEIQKILSKLWRIYQKSMILKMHQDTCREFLRYQESLGMIFDTTRRDKSVF